MIFDKKINNFVNKSKILKTADIFDQYFFDSVYVGSYEYLSPEEVDREEETFAIDYWALGCIIYFLFHNETPFYDIYPENIFRKIKKCEFEIHQDLDADIKDIILNLIQIDPNKRLEFAKDIKNHKFFECISKENYNLKSFTNDSLNLNLSTDKNHSNALTGIRSILLDENYNCVNDFENETDCSKFIDLQDEFNSVNRFSKLKSTSIHKSNEFTFKNEFNKIDILQEINSINKNYLELINLEKEKFNIFEIKKFELLLEGTFYF